MLRLCLAKKAAIKSFFPSPLPPTFELMFVFGATVTEAQACVELFTFLVLGRKPIKTVPRLLRHPVQNQKIHKFVPRRCKKSIGCWKEIPFFEATYRLFSLVGSRVNECWALRQARAFIELFSPTSEARKYNRE
jgi:hypothetical protein